MRVVSVLFILMLIISVAAIPAQAQEEVDIEYGDTVTFDFDEDNDEAVFIFDGEEGDVISAIAAFQYSDDIDYSATLEMELDDENDDQVAEGQNIDFLFTTPGLITELEADGEYHLYVTFNGDGEATMVLNLQETAFLSEDETTFGVATEGLPTLVGISVEDDGLYEIDLLLEDGDLTFDFYLLEFSADYPTTLANVSGAAVQGWSVVVELEDNRDYMATMGSLFSFLFSDENRVNAEVSLTMSPFED